MGDLDPEFLDFNFEFRISNFESWISMIYKIVDKYCSRDYNNLQHPVDASRPQMAKLNALLSPKFGLSNLVSTASLSGPGK
jgi:hypothetical protein